MAIYLLSGRLNGKQDRKASGRNVGKTGKSTFMGNIRHIPGYKILRKLHVYSPKSVVSAIEKGKFRSYWVSTETYEVLKVYIDMNIDGLKDSIIEMLGGGRCNIDRKRRSFYSKYGNPGRVCSCYAGRKVECSY